MSEWRDVYHWCVWFLPVLLPLGENCQEIISGCESGPCLNGGRCSDVSDSSDYMCQCKRGYSGDNCEYEVHPVNLRTTIHVSLATAHMVSTPTHVRVQPTTLESTVRWSLPLPHHVTLTPASMVGSVP